jgi:hypothetical protein
MNSQDFLDECRPEILNYLKEMYDFHNLYDSREILRTLSAFSARASWMRNLAIRSTKNEIIRFRLDEIDPFLEEVERQFKIYSRLISANEFEYKLTTQ